MPASLLVAATSAAFDALSPEGREGRGKNRGRSEGGRKAAKRAGIDPFSTRQQRVGQHSSGVGVGTGL